MLGKLRLLFWLGLILLFLPYFGITETWKTILTVAIGVVVILVTFRLRHAYKIIKLKLRRYEESQTTESINV